MNLKYIGGEFHTHKTKSGDVTTEGYSNFNSVDRMKEIIDPTAWDLKNYLKNPVVLFDHGLDPAFGKIPIGKALEVKPTDQGLWTKAQMSNSKTDKISAIRDLVAEGMLKTWSVGFDPRNSAPDAKDASVNRITGAELIEQSKVPIPMNQDSVFSVLQKRLTVGNETARIWLNRHVSQMRLAKKGHWQAAAVTRRIHDLIAQGELTNEEAVVASIAGDNSKASIEIVKNYLNGQRKTLPPPALDRAAKMLRLDKDFLVNLDRGSLAIFDRTKNATSQQEGGGMSEKDTQPPTDSGNPPPAPKTAVVYSLRIPKAVADNAEAAMALAESEGYKVNGTVNEDGDFWVVDQAPTDGLDLAAAVEIPVGDTGMVACAAPSSGAKAAPPPPSTDAPPPGDNANQNTDAPPADGAVDPGLAKEAYAQFQAERTATNEGKPGNPAAWIADEAKWEKAKEMAKAAGADDVYAFAVWAYLNILKGTKKHGEAPQTKDITDANDNPYLNLAGQTNVLLGTLIKEVQGMSEKLNGLADLSVKVAANNAAQPNPPPADGAGGKGVDLLSGFRKSITAQLEDVESRLKRLKV